MSGSDASPRAAVAGHGLQQVVSGGQSGVDRAALDAARLCGIPHGGWCPRGRLAEDGPIPPEYPLRETVTADYPERTERNVLDSDGTLILYRKRLHGGTRLTKRLAQKHERPCLCLDLAGKVDVCAVRQWLQDQRIKVLNVAGPRESSQPGIGLEARELLLRLLRPRSTDENAEAPSEPPDTGR